VREESNLAVVVRPGGDLRVEELPFPQPAQDEAVVRITYAGVCGSDLHYWRHGAAGESVLREPMVLGHEVSGTVLLPAADGSGVAAGTSVTVHPATPGHDAAVRFPADRPNLAPGSTYLGSAARLPHRDGAMARFVAIPSRMLRTLPQGVTLRQAALAEPASVAWHAVRRAGPVIGRSALVMGAGPIGALVVASLAAGGAGEIVVCDLHEEPMRRAEELGATRLVQAARSAALDALQVDVAVEASGTASGLGATVRAVARGGKIVMVGLLPTGDQPVPVSLVITREIDLLGSFRFAGEIDEVLTAIASGMLPVERVVTHEFAVEEALVAFETAAEPRSSGKVLIRL